MTALRFKMLINRRLWPGAGSREGFFAQIVYSYDAGHQAGYVIYDGDGKLLGRTTVKKPTAEGESATGSNARRKPR